MKNFMFETRYLDYVSFPSININNEHSLKLLDTLKLNSDAKWGNEAISKMMAEEDLTDRKYRKLLDNYMQSSS